MRPGLLRATLAVSLAAFGTAISLTNRVTAEAPATQPATVPSGDWFVPQIQHAAGVPGDLDAATFARLYPALARVDTTVRAATPRIVFDAMGSPGKPAFKLRPMNVAYQLFTAASTHDYVASKPRDPFLQKPDERIARMAAIDAARRDAPLCLDIETLPLDTRHATPEAVDRSVQLIAQTVGWIRAQDPSVRLFFYSGFPAGEYYSGGRRAVLATTRPNGEGYAWWQSSKPAFDNEYAAWLRANAFLRSDAEGSRPAAMMSSLFDGCSPPLYLYEHSGAPVDEVTAAVPAFVRSTLEEARKYNKPVYPFVCFYMLETPKIVPLPVWIVLMREISVHADGMILWDGPNKWDERKTLRVRIATLMAERFGRMTDAELVATLRKEFPGDAELSALDGNSQQTTAPAH